MSIDESILDLAANHAREKNHEKLVETVIHAARSICPQEDLDHEEKFSALKDLVLEGVVFRLLGSKDYARAFRVIEEVNDRAFREKLSDQGHELLKIQLSLE